MCTPCTISIIIIIIIIINDELILAYNAAVYMPKSRNYEVTAVRLAN